MQKYISLLFFSTYALIFFMSNFLEYINSPADVKKLSVPQLVELADEIRSYIIKCVSKTGGHLASNLGVVELTLALHCVFDFQSDKLLWDVGHQCYTHKIITGRKEPFANLRHAEGVSGFPNPAESDYDQFMVGHAGTAITTAIGMALGEQIRAEQNKAPQNETKTKDETKIVSIVGDACIVNGTSFEGLNNLGLVKRQMLIVLNDNSMAIDATVGAMAKYFSKVRLSQTYEDLRKTTSNILEHMPIFGKSVEEALERLKKGIRMALPASQMFESMNIPYFGPVDGHDIGSLIQLFEGLSELNHPVILHVYTKKGKGFSPADQTPAQFHSTGPFKLNGDGDAIEPSSQPSKCTFTKSFGDHLAELAEKDDKIIAITSAMCDGTGLNSFKERHPGRFYDVGIAESAAVDIAAGLAKTGFKPVVCIYSTFLQRSFDQIAQDVALQNLPVIFCIDRAGLVGTDGPTHHGLLDIGFLRMIPNLVLIAPANDIEMKLALEFAMNHKTPVAIRYPKDNVPDDNQVPSACKKPFEEGKSVTVKTHKDSNIDIVAYGNMLTQTLEAEEILAKEGIHANIINARFAAPIDDKIINLIKQGKKIITVEDHTIECGFGSAVLELAVQSSHAVKNIKILGTPRRFIGHDLRNSQISSTGISTEKIVEAARDLSR